MPFVAYAVEGIGGAKGAAPGSGSRELLLPAVLRLVAEERSRAVDREQRFAAFERAPDRHRWEDLGHEVGRGALHARVGRRDDADRGAVDVGLEAPANRLRDVAHVDG